MSFSRREQILDLLRKNGVVLLKELEIRFPDVSSMTLRRDLEFFEKLGEVVRIRGGARYIKNIGSHDHEDVYALRAVKNHEAKDKISRIALKYIETGRSIFLDSGSTAMSLARILPDLNFSILTSAPNIALEISKRYKPTVTLIGGLLNRATLSVSGMQSNSFINDLNFDTALMVASAFSPESGFTCGNYSDSELKKSIIKKAKQVIIMVDNSKFEKSMPYTFANFEDSDVIITNQFPGDEVLSLTKKHCVKTVWQLD